MYQDFAIVTGSLFLDDYARGPQVYLVDMITWTRFEVCERTCSCGHPLDDATEAHVSPCEYPEILAVVERMKGSPLWAPERKREAA